MSDTTDSTSGDNPEDLGPMPTPEVDVPEPNPGGSDALPDAETNLPADLDPADNPAIQATVPDPVKAAVSEGEDTSTEATKTEGDPSPAEGETPA